MPTTATGLLLFVLVLIPGFIALLVRERGQRAGRDHSILRETATLVTTSVLAATAACLVFALLRTLFSDHTPDVGKLVRQGDRTVYIEHNYAYLAWWAVGLWVLACLFAVVFAVLLNGVDPDGKSSERRIVRFFAPKNGARHVSAWWVVFRRDPTAAKRVTCRLADGRVVSGWLFRFNSASNDVADRDLVLSGPLEIVQATGERRLQEYGTMVLSAQHITELSVEYFDSHSVFDSKLLKDYA